MLWEIDRIETLRGLCFAVGASIGIGEPEVRETKIARIVDGGDDFFKIEDEHGNTMREIHRKRLGEISRKPKRT